MIFPKEIIVVGDGKEAEALAQVLRLFTKECHWHEHQRFGAGRNIRDEKPPLNEQLKRSPLIIAVTNYTVGINQIIFLINKLRTNLGWSGAFIAVMTDETESASLARTSLFGNRNGNFQFSELEGHAAVKRPLSLTELFAAVKTTGQMREYMWLNLLKLSGMPHLSTAVEKGLKLLQSDDAEHLFRTAVEVLESVRQLDWITLFDSQSAHQAVNNMSELSNKYPRHDSLTLSDCRIIIETVAALIEKSSIGHL